MTDEIQRTKEFVPEKDLTLVGANTACMKSNLTANLRNNAKIVS